LLGQDGHLGRRHPELVAQRARILIEQFARLLREVRLASRTLYQHGVPGWWRGGAGRRDDQGTKHK
jgi:hypothetical protein